MKKSILFTMLALMIAGNTYAVEPFVGAYGVAEEEGSAADYVGSDAGIIFGVEGNGWAVESFKGTKNNSDSGVDARLFLDVGSFRYSIGAGGIKEYASVTDTTGNWTSTTSRPHGDFAPMGLVQIEHSSGFFLRYTRHIYEDSFRFRETQIIGDVPVEVDSKEVSVKEGRDKVLLGYKFNF